MPKRTRDGRFFILYNNPAGAAQFVEDPLAPEEHPLAEMLNQDEQLGYDADIEDAGGGIKKRIKLNY